MEKFISLFYDIIIYLGIVPIVFGYYYFKYLNYPLRVFVIFISIAYLCSVTSQVLAHFHHNTHWIYYCIFIISLLFNSYFFSLLIKDKLLINILIAIDLVVVLVVLWDLYYNGMRQFFAFPFLFTDLLFLLLAIRVYQKGSLNRSIKILCFGMIINFIFDFSSTLITSYYYNYFQNKLFQIVFFGISPFFMLLFLSIQTYTFYISSKDQKPIFDQISDFN